ncbi:sirohydrochlorin chelatase [Prevotella sp. oral taxon 475]|uniref:sirohydrochlorin chelatase n=1 Tax=Prevotella sp. oral taxon 475 TaxID=712471 RepID=UPI001BAC701C|nr:CbiX/SirB N-terminal domain-containing protein [Prevotella sp. oral taxon 475]QUB47244.1 sirohydrochlorin chelatase [Prevotella sp. oral taxon 475]
MMKKILFSILFLCAAVSVAEAKNALVVIAHGSPMESWRKPVLELETSVRNQIKAAKLKGIDYVRVALMEYTEPSVASVVKDCEAQGVDSIFALPLFIAPSGHTEEDLPNILGWKYNPYVREELAEEKTEMVKSKLPIVLGPTFYYSYVLEKVMAQRVKSFSKDAANEAVIFLAHGDEERIGFWKSLLGNVSKYVKENCGVTYVDSELIEMGHNFGNELMPLLEKAAQTKKRIFVQGIYLTSDVKRMADRHKMQERQADLVKTRGVEIVYSNEGILPASSDLVTNWVVEQTAQWLHSAR